MSADESTVVLCYPCPPAASRKLRADPQICVVDVKDLAGEALKLSSFGAVRDEVRVEDALEAKGEHAPQHVAYHGPALRNAAARDPLAVNEYGQLHGVRFASTGAGTGTVLVADYSKGLLRLIAAGSGRQRAAIEVPLQPKAVAVRGSVAVTCTAVSPWEVHVAVVNLAALAVTLAFVVTSDTAASTTPPLTGDSSSQEPDCDVAVELCAEGSRFYLSDANSGVALVSCVDGSVLRRWNMLDTLPGCFGPSIASGSASYRSLLCYIAVPALPGCTRLVLAFSNGCTVAEVDDEFSADCLKVLEDSAPAARTGNLRSIHGAVARAQHAIVLDGEAGKLVFYRA